MVGKDEAELTMGFNGDMLNVFVTLCPQEAFCLILLLNSFFSFKLGDVLLRFSLNNYVSGMQGLGIMAGLKRDMKANFNLSSTLDVTSHTLNLKKASLPRSEQCLIYLKV